MARFNTSNSRDDRRNTNEQSDDWRAAFYVNIYLPKRNADGTVGKYKLGDRGLPVADKGAGAKLVEMYKKDPDGFVKMLAANLIVDVQSAAGASNVDFAFDLTDKPTGTGS